MPRWDVHGSLGEVCSIPRSLMRRVSEFIDLGLQHDKGRLIVYGHWDPGELISVAEQVYARWGVDGVRAFLHHHLMDYTCSLITKLKGGALVKYIVREINRVGFAEVGEDIRGGQLYPAHIPDYRLTLRIISLKREDVPEFIAEKTVIPMLNRVLNLIVEDLKVERKRGSTHLVALAESMRDCIISSARELVSMYIEHLLGNGENPCRSKR